MNLSSVIRPEDVILDLSVATKASLLQFLAGHAAGRTGVSGQVIHSALLGRENLGSTGIGNGVAVPHAPVEGLMAPFAALVILKKPVDFEAVDDLPVDIVFLLLSPPEGTGDYLKILAAVARKTRGDRMPDMLRGARSPAAAYSLLVQEEE
ncbi:PTS sugar transporter subunit IIA [Xanthobacter sp. TB0136]|uniref:PTS sugar transporter subunit IIA n=1 Tax=Xanthobacter sp. TB0136 TaxID=3459177 RepID=UPI00403939B5